MSSVASKACDEKVHRASVALGAVENREQSKDHGYGKKRVADAQGGVVASQHFVDRIVAFDFARHPEKAGQDDEQRQDSRRHRERT